MAGRPVSPLLRSGRTAFVASRQDQRFSYCAYIPSDCAGDDDTVHPLAVLVHGSLRDAGEMRDGFIDFAEANRCVVLCPLFPCGIEDPFDLNNYKHVIYRGIRFDLILLDMIEAFAEHCRIDTRKFLMYGFSGGGQFVHRFFYLHPERLMGLSIGAPGTVTLADPEKPWWLGTGRMKEIFGRPYNRAAMQNVPVHLVIGGNDVSPNGVTVSEASNLWMPGVNETGKTRVERLSTLKASLEAEGITTEFNVLPDVAHHGERLQEAVKPFFARCIQNGRPGKT